MTGTQPIGQGEALEARARELLVKAAADEGLPGLAGWLRTDPVIANTPYAVALRAITAALQPHIDHAVGGLREALERLEQANEALCATRTAETYNRMLLDKGAQDALLKLDDARRIARSILATPPLDNTVGLDAGTVERCAQVVEREAASCLREAESLLPGIPQFAWQRASEELGMAVARIRALASGDRS